MSTSEGRDLPLGVALLVGARTVAQRIASDEPAGEVQQRMDRALDALDDDLREAAPDFFVTGVAPSLSALSDEWDRDDAVRFLVELRCATPFFPYQFTTNSSRARSQQAALREMARSTFGLPPGTADRVDEVYEIVRKAVRSAQRWESITRKLKDPMTLGMGLAGAAALAGIAVAAAPAVAVVMPAASGLSGAAAVSAGLAQLGFGSLAAGGLGMVGGMWVLGAGGAVFGGASSLTAGLLLLPGGPRQLGAEVHKLTMVAQLSVSGALSTSVDDIRQALDQLREDAEETLRGDQTRNEPGCPRLVELQELIDTIGYATTFVKELATASSSAD